MEEIRNAYGLLDLFPRPGFCVKDGIIIKANAAAEAQLIRAGLPISDLLQTGTEEYAAYQDGCLYLKIQGCGYEATPLEDVHIFLQEQQEDSRELQALALASRELRQSLTSIMANTDRLFPSDAVSTDAEARKQAARINRGLFQMLRTIGNMSDASAGRGDSSCQEVRNIPALMDELFVKAGTLIAHTSIQLRYSGCQEDVYSLCDPQRLERAVLNLLSNAMKFTPEGGTIDASLSRRGSKLYLRITDSGSGIPPQLLGSFYARYHRTPGLEDSRFGIGLGFSLIRNAATAHGGTLLVDQPEGKGTRITMSLAIRPGSCQLRSPCLRVDYAGERDHCLIELSDVLPAHLYDPDLID